MKLAQAEFIAEAILFLFAQAVDDRPTQGIAHGPGRRLAVPIEIAAGLFAREMQLAYHKLPRFIVSHPAGLGLHVDDNSKRAPQAVLEHDKTVLFAFQKTLFLHELFAVKRPAFVENRRLVHQPRQRASRGERVGDGKLQVMAGIAFVHRCVLQADPVVLPEQIIVAHRCDVIIADLVGIFGRGREIGSEGNFVAAELRCVNDVQLFLGWKRDELLNFHKFARRFHCFPIGRENLVPPRMMFLDLARGRFYALARR